MVHTKQVKKKTAIERINLSNNDHGIWKRNCVRYAVKTTGSYFKLCVYREMDAHGKFGEHASCSQLRLEHLFTLSTREGR